ncbi:unnamed protein product [Ostreobium quekettii]|uniref:Uncharacterized protein n=1 Tax=Ostreobium quekettii TaxID=121088 RepID=A0A8S1JEK4_9CHLO|nr:unnamed protein product [Ostreobium quekettii]
MLLSRQDWGRTARFSFVGLTLHGPSFHYAFQLLDRCLGTATTLSMAAYKTVVGQVTIFPLYVSAFYWYMGLLEGQDMAGAMERVRRAFWPTMVTGTAFWPVANMANFLYVPLKYRVAYVGCLGLVWNSFLSWSNCHYG